MTSLPCGLAIETHVPLKSFSSWVVGGAADFLVQPKTVEELREAVAFGELRQLPITVLGGGTNVLISDRGVRGLTIALRKLAGIESKKNSTTNRLELNTLAGTSKSELLKMFLREKLEPALFLAGLPGDVGGGVVMNAGVAEQMHPREFTEFVDWIEVLRPSDTSLGAKANLSEPPLNWSGAPSREEKIDHAQVPPSDLLIERAQSLKLDWLSAKDLNWNYRHCEGWQPGLITRVGLSWELKPSADILDRVRNANKIRLSKQPLDLPSCGSVFRNPEGHKSGQLIESAGLKGYRVGGAKVSEKHANFIVNVENATASDIDAVIRHVKTVVHDQYGVDLRTEVVYLGDWV